MGGEISITTSNAMINDLLSTGGMYGMLILSGSFLRYDVWWRYGTTGLLNRISSSIIQYAESTGSLLLLLPAPVYFSM